MSYSPFDAVQGLLAPAGEMRDALARFGQDAAAYEVNEAMSAPHATAGEALRALREALEASAPLWPRCGPEAEALGRRLLEEIRRRTA